jgi:type IV pilus assembly protein PilX
LLYVASFKLAVAADYPLNLEARILSNFTVVNYRKSEHGAVLVVALVMVLVLTLIGVSGRGSVTRDEKMVSNMQNATKSFQGAEAALNECENFLRTRQVVNLVQVDAVDDIADLQAQNGRVIAIGSFPAGWWEDTVFWAAAGTPSVIASIARTDDNPDGVVGQPRCFTEYIGNGTSSMDSDASLYPGANSPNSKLVYRVTAFSFGADTKSQSVVESLFIKQ